MKSKLITGFGVSAMALILGAIPVHAAESLHSRTTSVTDQVWALGEAVPPRMGHGGGMGGGARPPRMGGGYNGGHSGGYQGGHRWGTRTNGYWNGGVRAPGGYNSYRRPFRGYSLPSYWINPSYSLQNYSIYGLSQPSNGYGWSRYYDDAVLTDRDGRVYDSRQNIDWSRYEGGYSDAYNKGYRAGYDAGVLNGGDQVYDTSNAAPVSQSGGYDGTWSGNYADSDGRVYQGSWSGTYQGEDGQTYQGDYRGTFIGEGRYVDADGNVTYTGGSGTAPQPVPPHWSQNDSVEYDAPPPPQYDRPDYRDRAEHMERCRRDNGLGGALIGGVVGGIAGNRIAGRGNRTAGTLIGAGVGAIAGAVIDKSERDPCDEFRRDERPAPPPQNYRPAPTHGYPPPAYYYPAPTVTTITIQPGAQTTTTTTTVTEETYYVTQAAPKKVWKPKTKVVCRCD